MAKSTNHSSEHGSGHGHDKNDSLSDAAETAAEFAEKWGEEEESKVVHCTKCYQAEKAEKFSKAATIFSLGAFIVSLAALALPFLRSDVISMNRDEWDAFMNVLETGFEKAEEQAKPQANAATSSVRPITVRPRSSSATVSSAAVIVAVSSAAPAETADNGTATSSEAAQASSEAVKPVEPAAADSLPSDGSRL
jgi:hypothetical protein